MCKHQALPCFQNLWPFCHVCRTVAIYNTELPVSLQHIPICMLLKTQPAAACAA